VVVGDGIREEANDLSQILKSSSIYDYTLNMVQMKLFRMEGKDEIIVIPHILAKAEIIERIQLKVDFAGAQTQPSVEITEIIKEADTKKTRQKIDETDFLKKASPTDREKIELILNHFSSHPVVTIKWSAASFLLHIPDENDHTKIGLLRVKTDIIRNSGYYRHARDLGLLPEFQSDVDQYFNELRVIGVRIEQGNSKDLIIVPQPLSSLSLDQVKKMIRIIDSQSVKLEAIIEVVEELKEKGLS
jgi:hypothetical protein